MDIATIFVLVVLLALAVWVYRLAFKVTRYFFGGSSTSKADTIDASDIRNETDEHYGKRSLINPPQNPRHILQIKYQSHAGQITDREIAVVDNSKRGRVEAYCYLRNDYRTFILSSVMSCVDLTTGEDVQDLYQHLGVVPTMEQKYEMADRFIAEYKDELAILLFVGKADGRLMRPERLLIAAYIETQSGETDDKLIDNAISSADVPSLAGYKRAVGRVSKNNVHVLSNLYDTAKQIVDTQKSVKPAEQEALDYIKSRLRIPA